MEKSQDQIKRKKIVEFLQTAHTGRIATIDKNGFPFIAPMNFVYCDDGNNILKITETTLELKNKFLEIQ